MKFGLLGKSLGHSFSKEIHNRLGDYEYELFEREENEIEELFKNPDIAGFNITVPYKQTAMKYCDEIDDDALSIGAINTIVKRDGNSVGYNTDIDGFLFQVKSSGIVVENKKVLILGEGGTSNTVYRSLEKLGAREILKFSRRGQRKFKDLENHRDGQIIVNCTPVGMYPNNLQSLVDLEEFFNLEGVLDVVYNPLRTQMILQAEELKIKNNSGLGMLVMQAKVASEYFQNKNIDDEEVIKILKNLGRESENIIIIGMPGSGKTTLGREIAKILNRPFVDTDKEIEKNVGSPIPKIFKEKGEDFFRKIEREISKDAGKKNGIVISTGGGTILKRENRLALKQNGKIYFIHRPLEKLSTKGRPLSEGGLSKLQKLYEERRPIYERFCDFSLENKSIEKTAQKIIGEFYEDNSY
ncbi:shikimate 5-dehydrogenase [Peptoniphilus sp. ING2-D1G]|nr:shikimate 5-dehydrogenase [Peptoniphilus sp. ING2-D1G]